MEASALLEPDWSQATPTHSEVQEMCRRMEVQEVSLSPAPFTAFLKTLRESHSKGGAQLVAFRVRPNPVFDWYASRHRLTEDGLLDTLLTRDSVRAAIPELRIPESKVATGLAMADPFLFDGRLAHCLFHGGAYSTTSGDGRSAKLSAFRRLRCNVWSSIRRDNAGGNLRAMDALVL